MAARHARAGRWGARPKPMLNSGPVRYEVGANIDATAFGGIAAVHRLVTKLGLVERIDEDLQLLKVHLPYHESDHVLNLAYNVACGGTRLEDIERLRHDSAYMNALGAQLIPDPTTAGDFCRRFSEADVATLMEAINAVRPQLWAGRGAELLGPIAYLDVDGTIAPTYGQHKAGMDMSYKGIWGYAPLIVSLANTKEVLYLVNRPGNAPSHAGAAQWIDKAIELVTPHAARVCLRGDTDFSLTAHFDRWAKQVDFVFAMDASAALRSRAEALAEACWTPLQRPAAAPPRSGQQRRREPNHKRRIVAERGYVNLELNGEDVAEFTYQPGKCGRPYRVIALRKNISKTRGEQALIDEVRYFFYITTRTDLTPAQVVACANDRCDQENVIEQLKNGVNALRVPLYDLVSNWAHMVIAALAWNIKSWFAMMLHHKADRRDWINMEFRRFCTQVILIPAMIIRRARAITVRIIGYHPSLDRFFSAYNTIERTRFG
ncbi:IS1380 family transposase [Mycobacterium sp. SM1]|nr:IS1380 family transposase [Mycobacterium sp. SM1]MBS4727640.1 IS1380 family transposase [Mycobacterium sp. SM1]MBS4728616.1 IS1380 family transposase [Mycobacterium sp. SM1]MBS4730695.1 IS1380 family transposase [Mycobacterium sp. SM1]